MNGTHYRHLLISQSPNFLYYYYYLTIPPASLFLDDDDDDENDYWNNEHHELLMVDRSTGNGHLHSRQKKNKN